MNGIINSLLNSTPLILGSGSLILLVFLEFRLLEIRFAKKASLTILIIVLILSILPFVMVPFPTTLIYPLSLFVIIFLRKKYSDRFLNSICFVHICYWIFSLKLLTEEGNTWGNSNAFLGLVSVSNSILFINFLMLNLNSQKWVSLFRILAGIVGAILIYKWTNGFELSQYNGDNEKFARFSGIILCVFSVIEGTILLEKRKAK